MTKHEFTRLTKKEAANWTASGIPEFRPYCEGTAGPVGWAGAWLAGA